MGRPCGREGCGKEVKGREDKKYCTKSCRVRASDDRNYKKVRPKRVQAAENRSLTKKQQATLERCRAVTANAAAIYRDRFGEDVGTASSEMHDREAAA